MLYSSYWITITLTTDLFYYKTIHQLHQREIICINTHNGNLSFHNHTLVALWGMIVGNPEANWHYVEVRGLVCTSHKDKIPNNLDTLTFPYRFIKSIWWLPLLNLYRFMKCKPIFHWLLNSWDVMKYLRV